MTSIRLIPLKVILCFVMTFSVAHKAHAAPSATAEGAAALKALVEESVKKQIVMQEAGGNKVTMTGDVTVEPTGSYYAVTMPHMTMTMVDGKTFIIGVISMNAMPTDNPDRWKVSAAIPSPMTMKSTDGSTLMVMDIGQQRQAGIWLPKSNVFPKLDATMKDLRIKVTPPDENVVINMSLGEVSYRANLTENSRQRWDGPAAFNMKDLKISAPADQLAVSIDSINTTAKSKGLDIEGYMKWQEELAGVMKPFVELAQAGQNTPQGAAPSTVKLPNPEVFLGTFTKIFTELYEGFDMDMTVKGLRAKGKDKKTGELQDFSLGSIHFGTGIDKINTPASDVRFTIGFGDLKIPSMPEEAAAFAPQDLNFDMRLNKFPLKEIINMGVETASKNAEAAQQGMRPSAPNPMQAMNLFLEAGTEIALKENFLKGRDYGLYIDGTAKPNPNSPMGAIADYKVQFVGLDGMLNKIKSAAQDPATAAPWMQKALGPLTMMQMFGQQDTFNGQPSRSYHFQATENGQMLMNGTDMSAMMGGAMGGGQPQGGQPMPQ